MEVNIQGKIYKYPSTYGVGCMAHDDDLEPTCKLAPGISEEKKKETRKETGTTWCGNDWCYLNMHESCAKYRPMSSDYVVGQYYSYIYCDSKDTFSN